MNDTLPPLHGLDETAALRSIMEGTATHTGDRFFQTLVESLARVLGTHGAWVTEYLPESRRLRALEPGLEITGVDLVDRPDYPGPFVRADAAAGLPFADGEFDLVYCSSVIEHVDPGRRAAFAAEVRRVGRGWFVQAPARSFPIEPHSLLPAAHWLPVALRRRYWRLGAAAGWEEISLPGRAEMEELFGPARAERFGPFVKSWVCVRPPGERGARQPAPERPPLSR